MSVNRLLSGKIPEPPSKKYKRWAKRLLLSIISFFIAIIAVAGIVAVFGHTSGGVSAPTDSSGARVYPASVDGSDVVDPATIAVRFTVHNNGSQSVSPACTINLQNAGGSYHGFDVFYMKPIAPGEVIHATGNITITSQGAQYVTQSTISCTAKSSDSTVATGKTVKVVKINDALGAYDSTIGWYWGSAPFVTGVSPNTLMKCTELALNASGKIIARHIFNGVSLNNDAVTGYGDGEDTTVNTTKAIAQSIKKVTATCSLN